MRIAVDRYKLGEKYTVISGYAGTGKSTLIRFIIEALDVSELDIRYCAITGKATNVLRRKGNKNTETLHKLLYKSILLPSGRYHNEPRIVLEGMPKIIIVDEVSMVPLHIWDLLCKHPVYIIACGDPGQLPPVPDVLPDGTEVDNNNHLLDNPHIFLDEVMRQAQESEIIRLSMHVRRGQPISSYKGTNEQVQILKPSDESLSMLRWGDQILCASNSKCDQINRWMREANGFPEDIPQIGDRVINRHNNWDILSNEEVPLTNGIVGEIKDIVYSSWLYPFWVSDDRKPKTVPINIASIQGDEDDEFFQHIAWDEHALLTGQKTLSSKEEYKILKNRKLALPLFFTFGYAITVWKAQGSEWNKVVLYEEKNWPRAATDKRKYLYTGVTRAIDKLVVVQKDDF